MRNGVQDAYRGEMLHVNHRYCIDMKPGYEGGIQTWGWCPGLTCGGAPSMLLCRLFSQILPPARICGISVAALKLAWHLFFLHRHLQFT